jgi:hypothetical protein
MSGFFVAAYATFQRYYMLAAGRAGGTITKITDFVWLVVRGVVGAAVDSVRGVHAIIMAA